MVLLLLAGLLGWLVDAADAVRLADLQPVEERVPVPVLELGSHPDPAEFYRSWIRPRRPVLLRGAAAGWAATKFWPDRGRLSKAHGHVVFGAETPPSPHTVPDETRLTLADFLAGTEPAPDPTDGDRDGGGGDGQRLHIDALMHDATMLDEIELPTVLQCKALVETLAGASLLWAPGPLQSHLHQDGYENLLVVMAGRKDVVLISSAETETVYPEDFAYAAGMSPVDPADVDLGAHPRVGTATLHTATILPGDMLYIPQYWWHAVTSTPAGAGMPVVGTSIWFTSFAFDKDMMALGLSEDTDVAETTRMFDELTATTTPATIDCAAAAVGDPTAVSADRGLDGMLLAGPFGAFGRFSPHWTIGNDDDAAAAWKVTRHLAFLQGMVPILTFGTGGLHPATAAADIAMAIKAGYRAFDSADEAHYNESALGTAIRESGIARSEFYVTTKLHPQHHGRASAAAAVRRSAAALGVDYIDLVLIHATECDDDEQCSTSPGSGTWRDSWRAFEDMKATGLVRWIGVSNFDVAELQELLQFAVVRPQAVQNWFDPFNQDSEVRALCSSNGIVYQGYSLLGNAWVDDGLADVNPVLHSEIVAHIAGRHGVSAAQVVLRWTYQKSVAMIVRSSNPVHLAKSLDIFEFELTPVDMADMQYMDGNFDTLYHHQQTDLRPVSHLPWLYTDGDDCLDKDCESQWQACRALDSCESCEVDCEAKDLGDEVDCDDEELGDTAYIECCTACAQSQTFVVRKAMRELMQCAGQCFALDR